MLRVPGATAQQIRNREKSRENEGEQVALLPSQYAVGELRR
jgi:hypothetical protein